MILVGAIFLAGAVSQAATGGNSITGLLGFSQSAINFGANYENRLDSTLGLGGYFHYSAEKKENAGKNQTISFGAIAPAHLVDANRFDAYIAPGFGITMIKGIDPQDDQTTFGPVWKMGVQFKMSPTVRIGLEQTEIINWFTDKAMASASYTNAAVNFTF